MTADMHDEHAASLEDRLVQFEAAWQSGSVPDVGEWLCELKSMDIDILSSLIEIDLEYRWKRFETRAAEPTTDRDAFPRFPRLENYADLLPERRADILSPGLIGEEYRARVRWGDHPAYDEYLTRFAHAADAVLEAITHVEAELQAEDATLDTSTVSLGADGDRTTVSQEFPEQSCVPGSPPATLGRYRLQALIGRGGFGEVWKAYDPELQRDVAIKLPRGDRHFSRKTLRRFRAEGQKLARLGRIPGIVTVFDTGDTNGRPFIVSDFIEGESLEQRFQRERRLPCDEAARLVGSVGEALHKAHLTGLVHRDIKPANILLDTDGNTYLADFGLAVTEEEQLAEGRSTVGTYAYMSPEQARGDGNRVDGRTDIYSLGVVLYKALVGKLPYPGGTHEDYVDQILNREPRPLRMVDDTVPVELERVCLTCLAKAPSDRYTTAKDVANALKRVQPARGAPGKPVARYLRYAVAAVLIVLAGIGLYSIIPDDPPEAERDGRVGVRIPIPVDKATELFRGDAAGVRIATPTKTGLRISARRQAALRLYETRAVRYRMLIRFRLKPHDGLRPAMFGVLLGYHATGNGTYRFQTIQVIRRFGGRTSVSRSLDSGTLPTPTSPAFDTDWNASTGIGGSTPGVHTLEVTVGRNGLELVTWDEIGLPSLTTEDANRATQDEDYRGVMGVVNTNDTVDLLACEVVILQHRWKRLRE